MSRVQEGLEPWIFENGDGKTYGKRSQFQKTEVRKAYAGQSQNQEKQADEAKKAERARISPAVYWQQCLLLKNAITDYISVKKLAMNAIDERKYHSVKHVIDNEKYYGGDKSRVFRREAELRTQLGIKMRAFNMMCLKNDLDQSDLDFLICQLSIIPDAGEKFKYHIEKHRDEGHPPFPLDELAERDFKFYHPAWYGKKEDSSI